MIVKFYNTSSENNRIGKTLLNETSINGTLKTEINLQNPIIQLSTNILSFNYCYIELFNRYYFIEKIELTRKNLYTVYLKIDVLETYKNQIKGLTAIVSNSQSSNPYYRGFVTGVDVRTEYNKYSFDNNFNEDGSIILIGLNGER